MERFHSEVQCVISQIIGKKTGEYRVFFKGVLYTNKIASGMLLPNGQADSAQRQTFFPRSGNRPLDLMAVKQIRETTEVFKDNKYLLYIQALRQSMRAVLVF